jgi:hypothetical protein
MEGDGFAFRDGKLFRIMIYIPNQDEGIAGNDVHKECSKEMGQFVSSMIPDLEQNRETTLCGLWLWPGKKLAQGLTSIPKDLESRTNWNAHAAQTDTRRSVLETREPIVLEFLFHTMGNSHLKSDGSP